MPASIQEALRVSHVFTQQVTQRRNEACRALLFETYMLKDRRNSANRAPATKN